MDISKINKNAKITGMSLSDNSKKMIISSNKKKVSVSPIYDKSNRRGCGGCSRRRSG